jgi:hypothetical protein
MYDPYSPACDGTYGALEKDQSDGSSTIWRPKGIDKGWLARKYL